MPIIAVADPACVPGDVISVPADVAVVIDAITQAYPGQDVLLLSQDESGARAARSARLVLGDSRIGLLPHPVPRTAYFLAVAAARQLPEQLLSLAGCAAALVTRSTVTRALLSTVSSLSRPAPSFGDHLLSLWPSSRFVADWTAGTVRAGRTLDVPPGACAVTARSENSWHDLRLEPTSPLRIDLPTAPGINPWGSTRWAEVSVTQNPLEQIVGALLAPATLQDMPRCPSCSRHGWGEVCLFCQVALVEPAALAAGDPAALPHAPAGAL